MRARVTDRDALLALRPVNMIGYLRSKGWEQYSAIPGRFTVWVHQQHSDAEVVVPVRREAGDFVRQLAAVLGELEKAEERSQLEIFRDLINAGFDVVRLRATSSANKDGSVAIEDGLQLFAHVREVMLASACAAIEPKPVYHKRKPARAVEYVRTARFGQTEQGSFIITVLSPVAPQIDPQVSLFPTEDPYERSVIRTLTRSLHLALAAAELSVSASLPTFEPFQSAVAGGVSANLCEGLAGLFKGEGTEKVDLSVTWSNNRPTPLGMSSTITIPNDYVPTFEEAARAFRRNDTLEACVVEGPIVKLERDEGDDFGRVTVSAPIEGKQRRVIVPLVGPEYDRATLAHRQFQNVRIVGDVKKEGRSYFLARPLPLSIVADRGDFDVFS